MNNEYEMNAMNDLKEKMDRYKGALENKYLHANTQSKKKAIVKELYEFSYVYKNIFGDDIKFWWEENRDIENIYDEVDFDRLNKFIDNINVNNDFYLELSNSVINSFLEVAYPFYKYYSNVLEDPKLNDSYMMEKLFSFFDGYDYHSSYDFKNKLFNYELLEYNFDIFASGAAFTFPSLKKNLISLNISLDNNLFKYSTIAHEYGHIMEINLSQDADNNSLIEKSLETPFYEVASTFLEYAFLNYLKDNKILLDYTNKCLDHYFKSIITYMFYINIISKFPNIQVDEDGIINLSNLEIIEYGNQICDKINYYILSQDINEIDVRHPYIYGLGQLLSVYLYENYKENPNFVNEFKKALINYPTVNDLSVFKNLGINKDKLLKGDVLTKVLKKHIDKFN